MRVATRWLSLDRHHGVAVDQAAVDELWRLRLEFMRLKPGVDPAADRAEFGACQSAGVFRDADGIQGFAVFGHQRAIVESSPVVFVRPTYGFIRPRHRRHPLSVVLAADAIARVALACPRHRILAVEAW